jgi:enterochelin esterase-like enzyme
MTLRHVVLILMLGGALAGQEHPPGAVVGDLRIEPLTSRVFGNTRMLRVWLPPGYDNPANAARRYPVLYLNDGQNLFDPATNVFHPREWHVDETVTTLIASGAIPPMIVVGIDNAGAAERSMEYVPYDEATLDPPLKNPRGQRFPEFLAGDVIPYIEGRFRVLRGPAHRALGGSSFGATIALHTAIAYPGLVDALLLESPSLFIANERLLKDAARATAWPRKVYLAIGTKEASREEYSREAVRQVNELAATLRSAGLGPDRLAVAIDEGAGHNAIAWSKRFPGALQFLVGNAAPSIDQLELHGVVAEATRFDDRAAIRLLEANSSRDGGMAVLKGISFQDGTIEVDVAGRRGPYAVPDDRGFIGIAFRVRPGGGAYEYIYLRPDNGRALDQVRRNHSTQYAAHPDFSFARLRKESPEKYESYVDLVSGAWTRMRIEVDGTTARLFVHDAPQPALVVNDLKLGTTAGGIGLWIGPGTEGFFANVKVHPARRN